MRRLIVWGAGELGGRVAAMWVKYGGEAIGFTKTNNRHARLQSKGIDSQIGTPIKLLTAEDIVLLSLPSHTRQQKAVQSLIQANVPMPARAIFISVTGYYGVEPQSKLINELTPNGDDARAKTIAQAEQIFFAWSGDKGIVIRAGGLYCQGRGPINVLAQRGYPRSGPPNKTMALIHYHDIAQAIVTALQHPNPATVYLAVSPPCPTRETFYTTACQQLGLPIPKFEPPLTSPPIQYDVSRLRQDLLPQPTYPDWRSALVQKQNSC